MVYTVDEGKSKMTKGSGGIYEKHKERLSIYPVIDITRKQAEKTLRGEGGEKHLCSRLKVRKWGNKLGLQTDVNTDESKFIGIRKHSNIALVKTTQKSVEK